MKSIGNALVLAMILGLGVCREVQAAKVWTGAVSTNWHNGDNWSPAGVPAAGTNVVINGTATRSVVLTNVTADLASVLITNQTVEFGNWIAEIRATTITIAKDGYVSTVGPFTNNAVSNRVHFTCDDFTIQTDGQINVDQHGFFGQNGPGAGERDFVTYGAGHGGEGVHAYGGPMGNTNDSASLPTIPGSGGGNLGDALERLSGGGAVFIETTDATIDGLITANGGGGAAGRESGGAGGAIYVACAGTLDGAGVVQADGGRGATDNLGGAGGGGRVAVTYTTFAPTCEISFSAKAGPSGTAAVYKEAQMGTLYFPDTSPLSSTLHRLNGRLIIPGLNSWSVPGNLAVSGNRVGFESEPFSLTVNGDLSLEGGAQLVVGGRAKNRQNTTYGDWYSEAIDGTTTGTNPVLSVTGSVSINDSALTVGGLRQRSRTRVNVGGTLTLTNNAYFVVNAGETNATDIYGAVVDVADTTEVADDSWVEPHSNPTNGGSVLFRLADLNVSTNAGFMADHMGYEPLFGPGAGVNTGGRGTGAGHGGKGGDLGAVAGGAVYDFTNAPAQPGSGGAYDNVVSPGWGGGAIRVEADNVVMDGSLTANGQTTPNRDRVSPGSGGSIFVICDTFGGVSNAVLSAVGGNQPNGGYAGSGAGGGRIAIWYNIADTQKALLLSDPDNAASLMPGATITTEYGEFSTNSNVYVDGGTSVSGNGDPGTVVFLTPPPFGTVITLK